MDQSPLSPPSRPCLLCAGALPKQDAKRRENKNNTPAYTKVNQVIIKKNHPLGGGTVCPEPRWPRAALCGVTERREGGRAPAAAVSPHPVRHRAGPVRHRAGPGQRQRRAPCVPLCLESGPKDIVQVLA